MANEKIDAIIELHGEVARRYKQYELAIGEHPPVPVLNELRYALRAIVIVLAKETVGCDESQPTNFDDFANEPALSQDNAEERALHALHCAYHDLIDGVFIDIVDYMDELTKKYTEASIHILGDRRPEIFNLISEIESILEGSRGNGLKRAEVYESQFYKTYFERLLQLKKSFEQEYLAEIVEYNRQLDMERHREEEQPF